MINITHDDEFQYLVEQFADIKIMRYRVPGFEELTLKQKTLLYYLSQAALCGRDILFDQFYRHNLLVRKTIDALVENYPGNHDSEIFKQFMVYAKRVWFSNGIHHHYSTEKFFPDMPKEAFGSLMAETDTNCFPLQKGESISGFTEKILSIIYDDKNDLKRVCFDGDKDLITASATNFYAGLTQTEVEAYNAKFVQPDSDRPLSQGLNSRLVKKEGQILEEIYKVGGKYSKAIAVVTSKKVR
jgi:dipeptidyl-peptidase-3